MAKCTYVHEPARRKIERIVELLELPMIWTEVAEALHCHPSTASRYLWHLARQPMPRRIHVHAWVDDEKTLRKIPVFKAGNGTNKRKPPALTDAEKFQRIQADPVRYAQRKEKYRVYWHLSRGQPVPARQRQEASPFSALGI